MERSRSSVYVLTLLLAIMLFAPGVSLRAQDSVPQGVIKVRRAPVPSDYRVEVSYSYGSDRKGILPHLFRRNEVAAISYPPDPVLLEPNRNDSGQTLLDSSFIITFYSKQGRPAEEFDWIAWVNQYEHMFAWNDTAGIDSATFVYTINSRGQMKFKPIGYNDRDSSAERLRENLAPVMKRLWVWYPATRVRDNGKIIKKTNCVVTVKVYAVRKGYGQNLPLNVIKD